MHALKSLMIVGCLAAAVGALSDRESRPGSTLVTAPLATDAATRVASGPAPALSLAGDNACNPRMEVCET